MMGYMSAPYEVTEWQSAHDLPAMVIRPTADSGFESVFAEKTVDTA